MDIQNFNWGRYIVEKMFRNQVLRFISHEAVKLNFRPYIRRCTSPNEKFEFRYPLSVWLTNGTTSYSMQTNSWHVFISHNQLKVYHGCIPVVLERWIVNKGANLIFYISACAVWSESYPEPNCLTLWLYSWIFFLKTLNLKKKKSVDNKKPAKFPGMQW